MFSTSSFAGDLVQLEDGTFVLADWMPLCSRPIPQRGDN